MGCTPSQSSTCIVVGQHNSSGVGEESKVSHESKESYEYSSPFESKYLLKEEEEIDLQTEGFLQSSIKSSKSELSSKFSTSSWDSGVYELDDDYSHIITENSDPEKVREVDSQFVPPTDLELVLKGKACPTRLSARDRELKEQKAILEVLREEGLIVRPPSKAIGGIRFELVSAQHFPLNESSSIPKLPPLTMRRKQIQEKPELTHEDIEQKLIKAEERRKKRTEEKLSKAAIKDRQEIQTIAEQQTKISRLKLEKKLQASKESRKKYLNEVQEKLKAREEHAKKVRERKQMLACGFKYILPVETEHK